MRDILQEAIMQIDTQQQNSVMKDGKSCVHCHMHDITSSYFLVTAGTSSTIGLPFLVIIHCSCITEQATPCFNTFSSCARLNLSRNMYINIIILSLVLY